ncbi:uncharacterized protein LOC119388998 isoform X2 [Rhipicephalus sanguineus]|uniref:uncharacterized protein LOC119388998 isoform X2 n=1 Tax=Rhipicephalus sanguineus TaxID=34632 RepID=UPI0020C4CBB1|nr:uncharacterized protein LOC119388998 isoform X2 [Rhipicephalus sanguineus]
MTNVAFALAAFAFATASAGASSRWPDIDPDLGAYQDETTCFPFESNLHQIYRNFANDPYLGGDAKCLRTGSTGALADSSLNTTFKYGSRGVLHVTFTLMSSPGYTAKNVVYYHPTKSNLGDFVFTVAYRDCEKCKIFRHNYIKNGAGCSYWLTDEALNEKNTCCEFVYALLCGPDKYKIYDDSCK